MVDNRKIIVYHTTMEINIGTYRTLGSRQLDEMLGQDDRIVIVVGKYPRYVLTGYKVDNAPVVLHDKSETEVPGNGKGRDDLNSESIGEDTSRNTGLEDDLDA